MQLYVREFFPHKVVVTRAEESISNNIIVTLSMGVHSDYTSAASDFGHRTRVLSHVAWHYSVSIVAPAQLDVYLYQS